MTAGVTLEGVSKRFGPVEAVRARPLTAEERAALAREA